MENDMTKTLLTKVQRACAVDIMTNAYETGIAYWVQQARNVKRDDDLNYLSYELLPADYDDEGTWFEVTPEKVWAAVEKLATGKAGVRSDLRKTFKAQWVDEDYLSWGADPDAETDDVAIQVACFGELVFG